MKRILASTFFATIVVARLTFADPGITVEYREGVPTIRLEGDYAGSRYTIFRARAESGPFAPISDSNVLCTGACYVDDFDADPGLTLWYRFDLELADGGFRSFGPYPVTISAELARRVHAAVLPNPGSGLARVNLFLAGHPNAAPLEAEAAIYDLQGRQQAVLHRGPLPRGTTRFEWAGRGRDGRPLGPGIYFLRFATPLGTSVTRLVRLN